MDDTLASDRQNIQHIKEGAEELNEIFSALLPWTIDSEHMDLLAEDTIQNCDHIDSFLDSIFLFHIEEVSVSVDTQDVADVIYKRHQAVIIAAYQSGYDTLTTIISGKGGGTVDIFLGVSGPDDVKNVFSEQVQGNYPGKGIKFLDESRERIIKNRLRTKTDGGILTGIPTQKIEGEKQVFDLTSVIRSMNGQEFLLAIVSRPVDKYKVVQQIHELMELKDRCHALANRTIGFDENRGVNQSRTDQITEGESSNRNILLRAIRYFKGGVTSHSSSRSQTDTKGWSESIGQSLSYEQQNTLAMELENIADKLITRLRKGLNTGTWESFITYATTSPTASKILSGTLAGELIKGDPEALPIRNVSSRLSKEIPLFIPKKGDEKSSTARNKLVSLVSSDEAALLMAPPLYSVPGYDIRVKPVLSLTDTIDRSGYPIGRIAEHSRIVKDSKFTISEDDIRKHIFVAGLTGSGKTTTVKRILDCIDTPFLVIESAKREYRRLLAKNKYDDKLNVYTVGDSGVAPIRHNPFMVLPGVSLITHIDNLKSIFYASFSLYGPMPYILEKCIYNIYRERGWNLTTGKHHSVTMETFADCRQHRFKFPTIRNLVDEVNRYVKEELEYKGELQDNIRSAIVARLESLAVGAKGFLFNTHEAIDIEDFLSKNIVLELESLSDDDDKAFFVGLILALVSEYRQSLARQTELSSSDDLRHILVIEEAHRLLKNVQTERTNEMLGNPKGKAVESFCNLIAEMRSYGQGVIVAEQIPTKIAPDVIKNTNTKIIHRLVSLDDQIAVGTGLGLEENECRYLNQLSPGMALAHKEGMAKPVEVSIFDRLQNNAIGDRRIESLAKELNPDLPLKLALHESGLLESQHLKAITLRLIGSLFLSNIEMDELLSEAIRLARKTEQLTYVEEETTIHALREWFHRILFSEWLGFASRKSPDEDVLKAVERLWIDRDRFDRGRFMDEFDEWLGCSGRERIKEILPTQIINEYRAKKTNIEQIQIVDKMLLIEDRAIKRDILTDIRGRVM